MYTKWITVQKTKQKIAIQVTKNHSNNNDVTWALSRPIIVTISDDEILLLISRQIYFNDTINQNSVLSQVLLRYRQWHTSLNESALTKTTDVISMVQLKTALSPVRKQSIYCILELNHWYTVTR